MARIRTINRASKQVFDFHPGSDREPQVITGWAVEVDEDPSDRYKMICSSTTEDGVRFVRSKPLSGGAYQVLDDTLAVLPQSIHLFSVDNEDLFFHAEYRTSLGSWAVYNGAQGNSNANWGPETTDMSWILPFHAHLRLLAIPRSVKRVTNHGKRAKAKKRLVFRPR
ncbi:hypothetical protein [Hymenobacter rubidus]|uniref:hypothetical protein n=1 Tax=Hymenobacter rubidus TaxID=1441626 RepID=UPI00191DF450|nr:hypothetical protein [Hymenobacter rubidus]